MGGSGAQTAKAGGIIGGGGGDAGGGFARVELPDAGAVPLVVGMLRSFHAWVGEGAARSSAGRGA
ncbi:hypothetical protein ABZ905_26240 [Streptomyces parvus]|uniref:hypothetical protein n=1 Tax=Streptomyces parvus TaxID=66428 RepID=UPI0033E0EA73